MKWCSKQYFALKASLPYLKFGEKPAISRGRFLEYCEAFLGERDLAFLRKLSLAAPEEIPGNDSAEAEFLRYETALRNAVLLMRSGARGVKGDLPLREGDGKSSPEEASDVIARLQASADPLEREKILDRARWARLEDLESGRFADLDALGIYCRKLLILEKWERFQEDKAGRNLEEAVSAVGKEAHEEAAAAGKAEMKKES